MFLGDRREAQVQSLVQRLAAIQEGLGDTRIVVLEAPQGEGKTRTVRELYARLVVGQPEPDYWPRIDQIGRQLDFGDSVTADRKRVGPERTGFEWRPHAIPSFLWWDYECERTRAGEMPGNVAADFENLVSVHGVAMWWAWHVRAGTVDKLLRSREFALEELREAFGEGGIEAATRLLSELGVPLPGLGWLARQAGNAWRLARERNDRKRLLVQSAQGVFDYETPARQIVDQLSRMLLPSLPAIIAIEDLHLMGPELAGFLDETITLPCERPVLVVATAWPGRNQRIYSGWLMSATATGRAEVWKLPALEKSDVAQIVLSHAPRTSAQVIDRVVKRWSNPLCLQTLLSLRRIKRQVQDQALVIADPDLDNVPREIVGLLEIAWAELPSRVASGLKAARAALPDGGSPAASPFIADVVAAGGERSGLLDALALGDREDLIFALELAREHRWLHGTVSMKAFEDVAHAEAAKRALESDTGPDEVADMQAQVRRVLSELVVAESEKGLLHKVNDRRMSVARSWLLSLSKNDDALGHPLAMSIVHLNEAANLLEYFQVADAEAHLQRMAACDALDADQPDVVSVRATLASTHALLGDDEVALKMLDSLLADHPNGLDALTLGDHLRLLHAKLVADLGNTPLAISEIEQTLCSLGWPQRAEDRTVMQALGMRAKLLAKSGNIELAGEEFRRLQAMQSRILGPSHEDTITTRLQFIRFQSEYGSAIDALYFCRQLLIERYEHLDAEGLNGFLPIWRTFGRLLFLNGYRGAALDVLIIVSAIYSHTGPLGLTKRHDIQQELVQFLWENGSEQVACLLLRRLAHDHERCYGSSDARTESIVSASRDLEPLLAPDLLESENLADEDRELLLLVTGEARIPLGQAIALLSQLLTDPLSRGGDDLFDFPAPRHLGPMPDWQPSFDNRDQHAESAPEGL